MNITQRLLAKDYLVNDYVVNVINCDNSSVAYGYAISKNKKDNYRKTERLFAESSAVHNQ